MYGGDLATQCKTPLTGYPSVARLTMVSCPLRFEESATVSDKYRSRIGRRIREVRIEHGFRNQAEFARRVGLHPSQLSRMERGLQRIDSVLLRRIADALSVPLDSLFPDDSTEVAALARRGTN